MSVKNGTLWGPNPIAHDSQEIIFYINNPLFGQIINRLELDIVLVCRLMDTKLNLIYWPANTLNMSLNNNMLQINHKYYKKLPLPSVIYLKKFCLQGRNVLTVNLLRLPRQVIFSFDIQMFIDLIEFTAPCLHHP